MIDIIKQIFAGDNDGSRRDAVKRKTAQYLQRAEQLVARLTRKDKKRDQVIISYPIKINIVVYFSSCVKDNFFHGSKMYLASNLYIYSIILQNRVLVIRIHGEW